MPFVQAKCPECGGMLSVDDNQKAAICKFCGNAFIVQEAVNNYITNNTYNNTYDNSTTHNYGEGAVVNIYENQSSVSTLLKRAFMFLEDGKFESANEYCEKVLDIEPENAQAYLGKLMVDLEIRKEIGFNYKNNDFSSNPNFKKVMALGDENIKNILINNIDRIKKDIVKKEKQREVINEKKRLREELIEKNRKVAAEKQAKLRAEEAEQQRIVYERKNKNLCQYCGNEFKGIFTKKCVKCGKPKDY